MAGMDEWPGQRRLQSFIKAVGSGESEQIRRHLSFLETKEDNRIHESCIQAIHTLIEKHDFPEVIDDILRSRIFKKKQARLDLRCEIPQFINTAAQSCRSLSQLRGFLTTLTTKAMFGGLTQDLDILSLQNVDGLSALHLTVIDGDSKATSNLLELGANGRHVTHDGNTPLSLAIAMDHDDLVSLLLPVSDVNTSDMDGDTPLMYASWRRRPSLVSKLINAGAVVNAKSLHGTTALWNAVFRSCPETVLVLLHHNARIDVSCEGTRLFRSRQDDDDNSDTNNSGDSLQVEKIYPGHKRSLLWVAADRIKGGQNYDKSMQILLTLLEAGYDVTKEQWLVDFAGNVPRRNPQGFLENEHLRDVLHYFHTRPQTLRDNCRGVLRRHFEDHQDFRDWLSSMGVDGAVMNFLSLTYLQTPPG